MIPIEPSSLTTVLTMLVVVVTGLGFVFVWARSWYRFVKLASKIPGPSLWAELTSLPAIVNHTQQYLYELSQSYDFKPFRLVVFGNIMVPISDPDDFAFVMKHRHLYDKPRFSYGNVASILGFETLLTLNGSTWKRHRKAFNPGFHQQILRTYIPLFNSQAQDFVKSVLGLCTGETLDISGLLVKNVLLTSLKSSIWHSADTEGYAVPNLVKFAEQLATSLRLPGISMDDLTQGCSRIVEEGLNLVHISSMNPAKPYVSYHFRNDLHRIRTGVKWYTDLFQILVSRRIREVESMLTKGDTNFSPSSSLEHTIARMKKKETFNLSDKELTQEVLILLLTGAETTSFALNATLALLALHPQVQEKVSEELLSIVIKEALRLFPPVPLAAREAKEDININGTVVPKGGMVGLLFFALHRNPKYFDRPDEFRPERFYSGNVDKLPQYGFIPFSAGPRNCIGSRYAKIQMKTFLSTFLRSFEVRPGHGINAVKDIEVAMRFTMHFTSGVPIRVHPRNWDKRSQ